MQLGGMSVAFLGGIDINKKDGRTMDEAAYNTFMDLTPGSIDVLLTHDAPYGTSLGYRASLGYRGDNWGSKKLKSLIEQTLPTFHVAAHVHHISGPRRTGQTTSWTLSGLVASPKWHPDLNGFELGCLAVLNTDKRILRPITDEWMADFDTKSFDFDSWFDGFTSYPDRQPIRNTAEAS